MLKFLKEDSEDGPPNLVLVVLAIIVIALMLSSCSTYQSLVQPSGCTFKKYKSARTSNRLPHYYNKF